MQQELQTINQSNPNKFGHSPTAFENPVARKSIGLLPFLHNIVVFDRFKQQWVYKLPNTLIEVNYKPYISNHKKPKYHQFVVKDGRIETIYFEDQA